jgi:two-component system chemotaxis response regulator CheY
MHVLIVEDSAVQRALLQKQLEQLGNAVSVAEHGQQAWELLLREHFPIVISDWIMPVLDGPALISRIRSRASQGYTYAILLTSKDERGDIVAGLEAGADDYLTKPCDPHELRARLAIGARIIDLEARLRMARDTDELTGLRNRRAITHAAEAELARGRREQTSLSVALLDVDNFKRVNDTYGHQTGDQALQLVASVVQQNLRPYDSVGRWGGEELLLMLVNTTLEEATTVAERVRLAVASAALCLPTGRQIRITVSMGVASVGQGGDRPLDILVQDADMALYRAKAAGRDCVHAAYTASSSSVLRQPHASLA